MANKKITQLASKSSVLSTDLFPIGDATTGTLYKKTIAELQAAIGGAVVSVNGKVGTVVLNTDDVAEAVSPTNLYFTNTRARGAISLTTTGSSGASTYSSSTGVLNVPTYTLAGLGGITATFLSAGTGITYNSGTGVIATTITQYTDALARASLSGTAPIGYNSTTGAISISQANTSTNGYLSSTDWNTFNGKQSTITLTTTGTSGAATFSAGTLNIPQYQAVLTNPVTGTGTSGYHAKWTSSSALGNGLIYDTGTFIGINKTSAVSNEKLAITGSTNIWGVVRIENDTNQADLNHGALNIVNTRSTYAVGNDASIMFSAFNSTASMQPRATIGMLVASDLGGHLVFNTRNDSGSGERMRILSDGRVAIGTTGTIFNSKFQVYQSTAGNVISHFYDTSGDAGYYFYNYSNLFVFEGRNSAGSSYKGFASLPYGGNFLIGTLTDNGEKLYVSGAIRATGTITANSDIILKKNLLKIENALEKVEQINGYTYEFKEDDSKRHAGVIAQEIQGVLPEIVNKGNDGILGVEYGNISALLIEAIKEQQTQINELKALLNK
jgi:hypothetical protein